MEFVFRKLKLHKKIVCNALARTPQLEGHYDSFTEDAPVRRRRRPGERLCVVSEQSYNVPLDT